ncbi:MAG: hypothetical protein A2Y73_04940 [Chloroflexi bacterium RBG_13_56_8]|nr:MAG: hypothetical protein A2Y73_04940 [Chloroflexi bacterium RBG_13_56_8]
MLAESREATEDPDAFIQEEQLEERLASVLAILSEAKEDRRRALIPLLQSVQEELGYVPEEAIQSISDRLGVPASEVFGVLTFYAQFRLTPQGRNVVKVCCGTACHVRGSARILRALENHLGIQVSETTTDTEFSLEEIRCFGSCSLAPVIVVNGDTYGRVTPEKALQVVESYRGNGNDS